MTTKRLHTIIWLLLCLALLRGIIYSALIPFDRSPDERYNFQLIKAKQLQLREASEQEIQQAAARVHVTARYLLYPEAPSGKYTLQEYADRRLPPPPSSAQFYYLVTGWLLKLLALEQIRDEIYLLRGISILCGVAVIGVSFLVTRDLFPKDHFMMIGVPVFLTILPQFSAMNGAISNDKFAELFLALMFWLLVHIFKEGMTWTSLAVCLITIGLALLSKRTALFALPLLPVVLLVYYWKGTLGLRMHLLLLLILVPLALGGYYLAAYLDEMKGFLSNYVIWVPPVKLKVILAWAISLEAFKYYTKFFIVIYMSFWGVFDYMTVHLYHFWYLGPALVQGLALAGLGRWAVTVKRGRQPLETWKAKVLYLLALSVVLVVLLMFFRSIIFQSDNPMMAQGRRLFTVLIPIGVLTLLGLEKFFSPKYLGLAAGIAFAGLFVLDSVCLANYILLNFHLQALFP